MDRALKALNAAIAGRDKTRAGTAAVDVAQSALDLELRYRPPSEIDLGRFELANQVLVECRGQRRRRGKGRRHDDGMDP